MLSGLKEFFDAAEDRIKSPFLGSITIVFILINWKSVYFLIFSGELARMKFNYFDANTTLWSMYLPIPIGIAAVLLAPRIAYIGAQLMQEPILSKRILQLESAHQTLLKKQELSETRSKMLATQENEFINKALRDQEVLQIENDDLRRDVQEQLSEFRRQQDVLLDKPLAADVETKHSKQSNEIRLQTLNGLADSFHQAGEYAQANKIRQEILKIIDSENY